MYIQRQITREVLKALRNNPVVAITGPRQCGKSTLAKEIIRQFKSPVYLDLERPSDRSKLSDAELFLTAQKGKLICIDEVQRAPDLFPLIRSLVDEWGKNASFLLLGSASRDLLRQSSESLAGRISYKRLTPFLWSEASPIASLQYYLSCGGFPRSLLAKDTELSFDWRESFISTFLERDLIQWRGFTATTMQRLWQMLAHLNGQTVDYSHLARALNISSVSVKSYIDLLASTYMLEVVPPFVSNLGKRLVKSPKVYVSDSGIATALLQLRNYNAIAGHPSFGALWEQIVLSNLKGHFPDASFSFYRTASGAEIDFVMQWNRKIIAIECKASSTPALTKGNYLALEDIRPNSTHVVAPVNTQWPIGKGIQVAGLEKTVAAIGFVQRRNLSK